MYETSEPHGGPRSRPRRSAVTLPALGLVAVLVVALASMDPAVLCALPALVLPALVVLRRYPGERLLAGLAGRVRRSPRPRGPVAIGARGGAGIGRPRGSLLLAFSLAVRPPPSAAVAAG